MRPLDEPSDSDVIEIRNLRRAIFVGALAAIGVFLLAYRGLERRDAIASNLAGFFALVVATFRTPEQSLGDNASSVTFFSDALHPDPALVGGIHFAAAALLFVTLAYMSLFLFTRTDQVIPTPQERIRSRVYVASGVVVPAAIVAIAVVKIAKLEIAPTSIVFWLEAVAMTAFGVSWLTKSEIIFRDEPVASSVSLTVCLR